MVLESCPFEQVGWRKQIKPFLVSRCSLDQNALWKQWTHRGRKIVTNIEPNLVATDLSGEKSELLKYLLEEAGIESPLPAVIPRRGNPDKAPLSFAQERLWFLDQLEPNSAAYNISSAFLLIGDLDIPALEQSLNEIVHRHEALRTIFAVEDGRPVQVIVVDAKLTVSFINLHEITETEREAKARHYLTQEAHHHFNLALGPLLRVTVLQLDHQKHILLLVMHHIISDGWSIGVLCRELTALYTAFSSKQPFSLADMPIQYVDFACWQRDWLQKGVVESQLGYWKEQLGGEMPVLELPTDRPRPATQTFLGTIRSFVIDQALVESLQALSRREGTTLFVTLLAAFKVLLYRYTGQTDISIGTPVANRSRTETEDLIGLFVNTLVLRTRFSAQFTFLELLRRVREVTLGALAHQDLPFEKLVNVLHPERDLSWNPLFQAMFVLQNTPAVSLALPGLVVLSHELDSKTSQFDLTFSLELTEQGATGLVEYATDLFDESTITRMIGHYCILLEGIATNPDQQISDLPILTEAESRQIMTEWNDALIYDSDKCIHQLFENQVMQTPDAVAVVFKEEHLTYAELNRRANKLAYCLRRLDVGPETLVGLCLERSLEMIIGLWGILKAGGAYVPLDPLYPKERLAFMVKDSGMKVLLVQEPWAHMPLQGMHLLTMNDAWRGGGEAVNVGGLDDEVIENLVYVNYTSGSVGQPKGVMIPHRALTRYICSAIKHFAVTPQDRILQFASISFDISAEEIYTCLLGGATLVLRTEVVFDSPTVFMDFCAMGHITILDLPTAYWHTLITGIEAKRQIPLSIRLIIIGGEQALPERVQMWHTIVENSLQIINTYGPTEATIVTTLCELNPSSAPGKVPIGKPIVGAQVYLLDSYLQLVPIGVPGELYIGGSGLARGYLNQLELTAKHFIPNPFSLYPGDRLYKTGDLARYLPDGNIEFLGRIDNQVKIRGFRIEPSEIESILRGHPAVQEAIVIVWEDRPGEKRLVAYILPKSQIDCKELRRFSQERLPSYMVPPTFVLLDVLPLTPSGKVDRRALPPPQRNHLERVIAPRTLAEKALADIWADVLDLEQVGVHDNFFDLGGHSLLAMQVIARINQKGIYITLQQFMRHPIISELAQEAGSETAYTEQGLVTGKAPCLPQQILILQLLPEYNYKRFVIWTLFKVTPRLPSPLLQKAIQYLATYHDALRTRFVRDGAGWLQFFAETEKHSVFAWIDLAELAGSEQDAAIKAIAQSLNENMNVWEGPLFQVAAFDLGPQHPLHLFVLVSHLIADGVSFDILMEDLDTACRQLAQGKPIRLLPKTTSVKHYAERLGQFAKTEALKQKLEYWLNIDWAKVHPLPESWCDDVERAVVSTLLSPEETRDLFQVSQVGGVQITDVLLTALATSFKLWTSNSTLLLRMIQHGRDPFLEGIDLSRTVSLVRVASVLFLNLEHSKSLQDALADIQAQLAHVPAQGVDFYLGWFLRDDAEIASYLKQCYNRVQVQFNLWMSYRAPSESLFVPVQTLVLPSRLFPPSPALHVSGEINSDGQLEFAWSYYRRYYHHPEIESLAQEHSKALRALIAWLVSRPC